MSEVKVEEGKFYALKNGETIGPVFWDEVISVWRRSPDFERNSGDYWHPNGSRYGHVDDDMDFSHEVSPPNP